GAPDPGEHVAQEAMVARHVDEADGPPRGQRGVGEAEIDRQTAPLLLGEAVRVGPRQRLDQRRLAVVDVAGGRDDGHGARRDSASATTTSSAGSTARRSRIVRRSWTRPITG